MARGEEGAEIDEFHAAFADAEDVVGLKIDNDDTELVKLREDGKRFVDGFLEIGDPFGREAFVGGVVAPGLEIFAVEKLHGDVSVFAFVIDVCAEIDGDEPAERFVINDVLEVGEFQAEAGVRAVGDFVGAVAVAFEVEEFDDDVWVIGAIDGRFRGLLEDLGQFDATEARKVYFQASEFRRHRCCCFDRHRTCGKIPRTDNFATTNVLTMGRLAEAKGGMEVILSRNFGVGLNGLGGAGKVAGDE